MLRRSLIGLLLWCFAWVALAASAVYEEGTHYFELDTPIRTADPTKVEVTEYFSYLCGGCFAFHPNVTSWAKTLDPERVVYNRTPAIFDKNLEVYAQTYYTADALGVLDRSHPAIFEAIHTERKALHQDLHDMAEFFAELGVDPVQFAKSYKSFGVSADVQRAVARGRAYRARYTPTLIVNGKYRVEVGSAGSQLNMLRVAEFLIDKELAAREADKPAD